MDWAPILCYQRVQFYQPNQNGYSEEQSVRVVRPDNGSHFLSTLWPLPGTELSHRKSSLLTQPLLQPQLPRSYIHVIDSTTTIYTMSKISHSCFHQGRSSMTEPSLCFNFLRGFLWCVKPFPILLFMYVFTWPLWPIFGVPRDSHKISFAIF